MPEQISDLNEPLLDYKSRKNIGNENIGKSSAEITNAELGADVNCVPVLNSILPSVAVTKSLLAAAHSNNKLALITTPIETAPVIQKMTR